VIITKAHCRIAWPIVSTASPEHYMITPLYIQSFFLVPLCV